MNTHLFFDAFSIKLKALKSQTEEKLQNSKKAIRNMNASKGFTDSPKEFKELVKAIEELILPLISQVYEDLKQTDWHYLKSIKNQKQLSSFFAMEINEVIAVQEFFLRQHIVKMSYRNIPLQNQLDIIVADMLKRINQDVDRKVILLNAYINLQRREHSVRTYCINLAKTRWIPALIFTVFIAALHFLDKLDKLVKLI